ncbi:hypothetical protein Pen02_58590 [Plantactinospora endophytica]|uniref:Uncharacterized protein n=1 Tax=Plantactinospora endophytica TaxID=673535 RepID=A0ABQ4E8A7_9ACTN|nr:hypothetical protein Pen02_58590 [Plantactinospora endophytica]
MTGRASVQFAGTRALMLRVLAVDPKPTYYGWAWITGYVLDHLGEAVERREIFVQPAGLQLVQTPRPARHPVGGRRV